MLMIRGGWKIFFVLFVRTDISLFVMSRRARECVYVGVSVWSVGGYFSD